MLSRVIVAAILMVYPVCASPAEADATVDFERRAEGMITVIRDAKTGEEFGTLDIEIASSDSTQRLSESLLEGLTHERGFVSGGGPPGHSLSIQAAQREDRRWIDFVVEDELTKDAQIHSIFAHFRFTPLRNGEEPDFVFSPQLRPEDDQVIGQHVFRSPALMIQKGGVFCALLPNLEILDEQWRTLPGCLDMDFSGEGASPRLSFGLCPYETDAHVYYRSDPSMTVDLKTGQRLKFGFSLFCDSDTTTAQALRSVVGSMWDEYGHSYYAEDIRPQVIPFDRYAEYGYEFQRDYIWREFELNGEPCGGSVTGVLGNADSIWFQAWFNNLRTAYGMYLFGKESKSEDIQAMDLRSKAQLTRNLVLNAPQNEGIFPTLYNTKTGEWVGYYGAGVGKEHYHTLDCSWTLYWLLRWHQDLEPDDRTIPFCERYADFLIRNMLESGCIPSWFKMDTLDPIETFRDLNAETTASALFLAELYRVTKEEKYLSAARKAGGFIVRDVIPENKWFDYETYFSCSRKPLDFYDKHTKQWPQNNLSIHWAAEMFKVLHQATGEREYLDLGVQMLDYLSLYQQVWSPSYLSIYGFGGFGVQNTDAEWHDARQAVFATTYLDYYELTGNPEYFERGVAAIRASFACMYIPENRNICPKVYRREPLGYSDENYGHGGWDTPAGPTTFDWGTGSGLAAAAYARHRFGDVFLDLDRKQAFGIDGVLVRDLDMRRGRVSMDIVTQVSGADTVALRTPAARRGSYRLRVNGEDLGAVSSGELRSGVPVAPRPEVSILHTPPRLASRRAPLRIAAEVRGLSDMSETQVTLRTPRAEGQWSVVAMEETEPGLYVAEMAQWMLGVNGDQVTYQIRVRAGKQLAAESGEYTVSLVDFVFADCGDDDEQYLSESGESWISGWSAGVQAQFAGSSDRVADFDQWFVYTFPVDPEAKAVRVSFEEEGGCLVTVGGETILDEGTGGRGEIQVRQYEFDDPSLWHGGEFSMRFEDSDPSDGWGANIAWIKVEASD